MEVYVSFIKPAPMKQRKNANWQNVSGMAKVRPAKYYLPENLADIQNAVREAEKLGIGVRAVGSGHSFSDIALTEGILLDMQHMNRLLPIDKSKIYRADREKHLVQVEGGMGLKDLIAWLDDHALALPNLGTLDHQTISGAIATGTHGTGLHLPALPSIVRSMLLVAAGGKKYRIEPKQGITDPAQFEEPETELIQDDTIFRAALVHLGMMGIVYSYVLEVRPAFWMVENRSLMKWSSLKPQLRDGSVFGAFGFVVAKKKLNGVPDGLYILVNPHEQDGDHTCVVVRTKEIAEPKKRPPGESARNPISEFIGGFPPAYYANLAVAKLLPKAIPGMVDKSLKTLKDTTYTAPSFMVMLQGMDFLMDKGFGSEFSYPLAELNWIDAMEGVFKATEKLSAGGLYPSSAPAIRFAPSSPALIAAESDRESAFLANPVVAKQVGARQILDAFQDVHFSFGGRPHWGKMNNRMEGYPGLIRKMFPHFEAWRQVMLRFNPNGTFDNAFTRRFRLRDLIPPEDWKPMH